MSTKHQRTHLPSDVLTSIALAPLLDSTPLGVQARSATMVLFEGVIERPNPYTQDVYQALKNAVGSAIYITDDIVCEYIVECRNEYGEESE